MSVQSEINRLNTAVSEQKKLIDQISALLKQKSGVK